MVELFDEPVGMLQQSHGRGADERGEVHAKDHLRRCVGLPGVRKSGVGLASARHGKVVALAAVDLGGETGEELASKRFVAGNVHANFVLVG